MNEHTSSANDPMALRDHVVGKEVAALHVYGINSLKSVDPQLSDLTGQVVSDLAATEDGRRMHILLGSLAVEIDLARTGTTTVLAGAQPWEPVGRSSPPTGRLIFSDGSGVDFKEPARTKRITFAIRRL